LAFETAIEGIESSWSPDSAPKLNSHELVIVGSSNDPLESESVPVVSALKREASDGTNRGLLPAFLRVPNRRPPARIQGAILGRTTVARLVGALTAIAGMLCAILAAQLGGYIPQNALKTGALEEAQSAQSDPAFRERSGRSIETGVQPRASQAQQS